jgi:hypothetical protein
VHGLGGAAVKALRGHGGEQTTIPRTRYPNAGERAVGLYAVGFQMSRNSKNKNPTRTKIFRGSNTQLSVV